MIGAVLAERYTVTEALGAGGAAATWLAEDRDTGRRVAVKVFDLGSAEDWKAVELFEREARVLAAIDHPAIPAYIELHPPGDDGQALLVQELAPGMNLHDARAARTFDEAQLRDLARQILEILSWLGTRTPPIVHRDIKPQNLVLDDEGTVRLVDFGGVREARSEGITVVGTFGYMAPEQAQGQADPRSDLYGLGMTLVFLLTGQAPKSLPQRRLKPEFRPASSASSAFLDFVDKLIEPVPDDRFATAEAALAGMRPEPVVEEPAVRVPVEVKAIHARSPGAIRARSSKDRVEIGALDDGHLATIHPAPGRLRGQVAWHALAGIVALSVGAGLLSAGVHWGAHLGVLAALAVASALIHGRAGSVYLRVSGGRFVLYRRSPDRPSCEGATHGVRVESSHPHVPIVNVYLPGRGTPLTIHPATWSDGDKLRDLFS
jgi:hypothetical protein